MALKWDTLFTKLAIKTQAPFADGIVSCCYCCAQKKKKYK